MIFELLQMFNFVLLSLVIALLVYNHKQHRIIDKKLKENRKMYHELFVMYGDEHLPKAVYFDRLMLNFDMLGLAEMDMLDRDQLAALGAVTKKYIEEYQAEVKK